MQSPEATVKIDNSIEIKDEPQHIITAVCLIMLSDIFGAEDGIMLSRIIHLLDPEDVRAPVLVSLNELARFMKLGTRKIKKILSRLEENGWLKFNSIQSDKKKPWSILLIDQALHKFRLADI